MPGFSDKRGYRKTPVEFLAEAQGLAAVGNYSRAIHHFRKVAQNPLFGHAELYREYRGLTRVMFNHAKNNVDLYGSFSDFIAGRTLPDSKTYGAYIARENFSRLVSSIFAIKISEEHFDLALHSKEELDVMLNKFEELLQPSIKE